MAERDYLREMMREYPLVPSHALWRAVELRILAAVDFPEPVLDLGCGEARFARLLFGAEKTVVGLDLTMPVLRQAIALNPRTLRADATSLPFPDATFGSIMSNCVLEHIPDDVAVVREMSRVLKPEGVAAITVPAPTIKQGLHTYRILMAQGRQVEAEEYWQEFDARLSHLHYRTAQEWREILATAGLSVTAVTPYMPAAAVTMWSRLETHLMQPLAGITDYWKLLAYSLCPPALRRWLMYRILRRYVLMDAQAGEPHGGWLITARKPSLDRKAPA